MEKAEKERKIVGLSSSDGDARRRQPLKIVFFGRQLGPNVQMEGENLKMTDKKKWKVDIGDLFDQSKETPLGQM
jgi:hypothetical protein